MHCRAAQSQQLWGWRQPHWPGPMLVRLLRSMRGPPASTQHKMRTFAAARQVTHHRTQPSREGKHGAIPHAEQAPRVIALAKLPSFTLPQTVACSDLWHPCKQYPVDSADPVKYACDESTNVSIMFMCPKGQPIQHTLE